MDITADQFASEVTERVIVVSASEATWHQTFEQQRTGEADFRTNGGGWEQAAAYQSIRRVLTDQSKN